MSTARPRVDAMQPSQPGPTRTADPRPPDRFPGGARYRTYVLFGLCGGFALLSSLLVLRTVWALGNGEEAWNALIASYAHPAYVAYHALAFVGIVWFALRFFSIFPKAQPPRIGPAKPPPEPVLLGLLNGGFAIVTLVLVLILWGVVL